MAAESLVFTEIVVRRMPGFADGGFDVDHLCGGVNLVYGPNASGKTTLGRAIRRLLWPDAPGDRHAALRGRYMLNGQPWLVDLDGGRVRYQRAGADADRPLLAPSETRDRYLLALHELLTDESSDFAAAIARESAGGYDVEEAAATLYKDVVRTPRAVINALKEAREDLRAALGKQEDLLSAADRLADLESRRQALLAQRNVQELIERALRFSETEANLRAARASVEAFAPELANLRGDELEALAQLQGQEDDLQRQQEEQQRRLDKERARRLKCKLPEGGVPAGLVAALRLQCGDLRDRVADVRQRSEALASAKTAWEAAAQRLGMDGDGTTVARLDRAAVQKLLAAARRAEELRVTRQAADEVAEWIGGTGQKVDPLPDHAVALLYRWIALESSQDDAQRLRWLGTAVGGVALLAALVLAWSSPIVGLLLLVAAAALVFVLWQQRSRGPRCDELRAEFEQLNLGSPSVWNAAEVARFAQQLQRRGAEAAVDAEKTVRWSALEARRAKARQDEEAFTRQRAEFVRRLGLDPGGDAASDYWLAEHVARLQAAHDGYLAAQQSLAATCRQRDELLRQINAALAPFGYETSDDAARLVAFVEDLDARQREFADADRNAALAEEALDALSSQRNALDDQRRELFARLNLAPDDEARFVELAQQYEAYHEARQALRLAEHDFHQADEALAEHPQWKGKPRETLWEQQRSRDELAAELDALSEEIGGIQQAIRAAKQSADVEMRLARREACEAQLREQRERNYRAAVGTLLAERVQQETRERDRPAVFRRARQLFARITHGRYELEMDEAGDRFRAVDTTTGLGHALDELSSGTRLQLLLAVRVAFVEGQEHGPRLPLVLDETLGNSDETRAREIIEAAIEICRDGRQLFYFTAQQDEVAKWRAALRRCEDVPHQVIDLAQRRGFSEQERLGDVDVGLPPPVELPAPEGDDWLQYGRRLRVPGFDPRRELGGAHLWYVVDEPAALHRLLRLGINNWGQFNTLARFGRAELDGQAVTYDRAQVLAKVLAAYCAAWRIGRGRPVDRAVLEASGAVTTAFIDAAAELAERLGGDARRLIAAIEEGGIPKFRRAACAALREYLAEQGYLDESEPLDDTAIRTRVVSAVLGELNAGQLEPETIDRLLAVLDPERRG